MPIIVCGVYLNPGGEVLFADAFMCIQQLIMLICNSHTESVSSEVLPWSDSIYKWQGNWKEYTYLTFRIKYPLNL